MYDQKLIDETRRVLIVRYPKFAREIAATPIRYSSKTKTASTNGKNIYINPKYFASLTDEGRLYLMAHEFMHIKFEHMHRLKTKDGEMRDFGSWNIATDAIIDANLERDGFTIPEGYVKDLMHSIPNILDYNAEELYEKIRKEKHGPKIKGDEGPQEDGDDGKEGGESGEGGQSETSGDHSQWEKAFKQHEKKEKKKNKKEKQKNKENKSQGDQPSGTDERNEFAVNRDQRRNTAIQHMQMLKLKNLDFPDGGKKVDIGEIGQPATNIDYLTALLRREFDKTEEIWSQRRSVAENNYAYRLEDYDTDDEAWTEFIIDASGSVSLEMIRAALRLTKSLLNNSRLRVGCVNAKFWGFVEIKSEKDIDNFTITDEVLDHGYVDGWDLAVRSFTKDRQVNRIMFTDGGNPPCGIMPKDDLKDIDVIWLDYYNKNFHPCCGKVIFVDPKDLMRYDVRHHAGQDISKSE